MLSCASTKVLAFESQIEDFLCQKNSDGLPIDSSCQQPAGTYMKLRPSGFNASAPENSRISEFGDARAELFPFGIIKDYPVASVSASLQVPGSDPATFEPYDIPAGSIVEIKLNAIRNNRGGNCQSRVYKYNKTFTASNNYDSLYDWAVGDNIDFTNGEDTGGESNAISFDQTIYPYPVSGVDAPPPLNTNPSPNSSGQSVVFFQKDEETGELYMSFGSGTPPCTGLTIKNSFVDIETIITRASTLMIFETEPIPANDELYYENEQTFDIVNGFHLSGSEDADQDQTASLPAIIDLTFFNCYVFGNGVESDRVLDALVKPASITRRKSNFSS